MMVSTGFKASALELWSGKKSAHAGLLNCAVPPTLTQILNKQCLSGMGSSAVSGALFYNAL